MNIPTLPARLLPLLLAACAGTPPAAVPAALEPGGAARLAMTVSATGVQIYECRAGNAGGAPSWVFVAPEAELFDARGQRAGQHGAGPFWQANDGSRIVGQVVARADAPRAGAIPWLLLKTQASGSPGVFASVTHVQRVNTQGGVAPATCTAEQIGTSTRIPYTADYRLFSSP